MKPTADDGARVTTATARHRATAVEQAGPDIAYRVIDSPVGGLLLAATGAGLVRVAFVGEDHDAVLEALARQIGRRLLDAPARLDPAAEQLDDYFVGRRRSFDLPLDFSLSTGFRRRVQEQLPGIAYGSTATYRELAERVGSPAAVRAVGTACATNPLPVVVPCHRVVRADGGLGGYLGGLEVKTALLELEGAFGADGRRA